jgi:glycosyltransferase involved in cell wall biosynthesis
MKKAINITVVIQSYLGAYAGAATWRDRKIIRAVDSFFNQAPGSYTAELIIVADGCAQTAHIVNDNYKGYPIKLLSIEKQQIWSGVPRSVGIANAHPDSWVCYLDVDDYFGENHLSKLADGLADYSGAWAWFNNHVLDVYHKPTEQNNAIEKARCGTCNIVHKSGINKLWQVKADYLHDWNAIQNLVRNYPVFEQIATPEYIVCHLPKMLDV